MRALLAFALTTALTTGAATLPGRLFAEETARPAATLVADRISVGDLRELVAEGNVEVFYGKTRLEAARIVYDRDGETLAIEGPITLTSGPDTVFLADSAELSADMTEGILRSARMVLDQQLQIAAADIQRVAGRYNRLGETVASTCKVCVNGEVPLWQIRASRIIHDEQEGQIYFDHARLEVAGVPVFYLPHLRVPDPSRKRATGFLTPSTRITDQLGTGIKIPYFIELGPSQDLTLTPYLSGSQTRTLELRYRRAFTRGEIELNGAISRDDILEGETRHYLFAEGRFDLPRDLKLDFDIETVSDRAYLLDYGYSEQDRLESSVEISRARRDELIRAEIGYLESLRDSESNATIPSIVGEAEYVRRFEPAMLGGLARLEFSADMLHRRSTEETDGPDFDAYGDGMDLGRVTIGADWRRDWTLRNGMVLATLGAVTLDHYEIGDDDTYGGSQNRLTPGAAVELRWPMVKSAADGSSQILEPVVQLAWSRDDDSDIPNEDGVLVEFDEGNLFSMSRFSGDDARETGLRANFGLGWTRYAPSGWALGLTVGRIWRFEDDDQFASGSGLEGDMSDWLTAIKLDFGTAVSLTNRAVFDDSFDFTKNDLRIDWEKDGIDIGSSLLWVEANPSEERLDDRSEWLVDAAYDFHRNWTGKANWRYDFVADEAAKAGLGLEYSNECVSVDLSLSRRFTSSTNVNPSTDFDLTVSLAGFGSRGKSGGARRCMR
ncbi:LPS-assembly protein LptD [Rhodovulum visakhapatnamense]|uniref:LPS-assembly protein LptD n=1 Tax=Rhodovulum visakhapatnamense TaxID=364297 RepID=A0A4R8FMY4_9RHOB|nr:LPS assembly protein LptD [Rhodovulum visakhapatnamense]TDX27710.1 LPS-assembly protein [Rhodovulum visakhapatnamense]